MQIIIRMTEEEFEGLLQQGQSFKSKKEMATYLENTYNGGEPCDIVQITGEHCDYYIYMKSDKFLGK